MRTVLVTLSGTHGTGKSTNAGRCYYLLNNAGLKFSYLRHQDLLDPWGFVIRRAAKILGFKKQSNLERTRPGRILWSIYFLFIYYPLLVGGINLRRVLGYSIVSDRYLYDLIVGFWSNGMRTPLEPLLLRITPRPDISFVLDADEERILGDRPEHSAEYIRREKWLYGQAARAHGLKIISTDDPAPVVWKNILSGVQSALEKHHSRDQ